MSFITYISSQLEIRARNNPSPTLPIYLSRVQVTLIIYQNCQKDKSPLLYLQEGMQYKKKNICTQILTTQTGNCFIFKLFVVTFTFKSLTLFYYNQTERITFNGFVNNGIHPDNSTAKHWMFVSRPGISCDLDVQQNTTRKPSASFVERRSRGK